ncbi:MAG TPA: chemotaxis protein CheW [Gammaproteobacteria bacterium]|nr:chemotaxis protein CheW [Gammaproteobacteria bacterium]
MVTALADLRSHPFDLLQELERRSRIAASGRGREVAQQEEWVGVGFRVANTYLVAAREEVREVLPFPGVTKLPGAKPWLLGLANVRGQLLPVTDLNLFFGGAPTDIGRMTRVLMVNHADIPAGLLVDEVRGFRRFVASDRTESIPEILSGMTPFISGVYSAGDELWGVLGVPGLVENPMFLDAAR